LLIIFFIFLCFFHPQSYDLFEPTDSTFLASSQLTTSIHWPCYCTIHVYVVIHICDMLSFWVETNLFRFCFKLCVYICIVVEDLIIKEGVRIPFTDLTRHIFVLVFRQDLNFQRHMSWSLCVCCLRWEVDVRFVDIGGIVLKYF
jgi:hypothetical protein